MDSTFHNAEAASHDCDISESVKEEPPDDAVINPIEIVYVPGIPISLKNEHQADPLELGDHADAVAVAESHSTPDENPGESQEDVESGGKRRTRLPASRQAPKARSAFSFVYNLELGGRGDKTKTLGPSHFGDDDSGSDYYQGGRVSSDADDSDWGSRRHRGTRRVPTREGEGPRELRPRSAAAGISTPEDRDQEGRLQAERQSSRKRRHLLLAELNREASRQRRRNRRTNQKIKAVRHLKNKAGESNEDSCSEVCAPSQSDDSCTDSDYDQSEDSASSDDEDGDSGSTRNRKTRRGRDGPHELCQRSAAAGIATPEHRDSEERSQVDRQSPGKRRHLLLAELHREASLQRRRNRRINRKIKAVRRLKNKAGESNEYSGSEICASPESDDSCTDSDYDQFEDSASSDDEDDEVESTGKRETRLESARKRARKAVPVLLDEDDLTVYLDPDSFQSQDHNVTVKPELECARLHEYGDETVPLEPNSVCLDKDGCAPVKLEPGRGTLEEDCYDIVMRSSDSVSFHEYGDEVFKTESVSVSRSDEIGSGAIKLESVSLSPVEVGGMPVKLEPACDC